MLLIFATNVANASSLLGCCQKQIEEKGILSETPPCHHSKAPIKNDNLPSKCLCTFMATAQIDTFLKLSLFKAQIILLSKAYGLDDIITLHTIRPESPPPKLFS